MVIYKEFEVRYIGEMVDLRPHLAVIQPLRSLTPSIPPSIGCPWVPWSPARCWCCMVALAMALGGYKTWSP